MSVNSTDPGALFGGTWSRIQGRFLLAAGGGYSAGSTGGEAEHTLTVDEIPSHNHSFTVSSNDYTSGPSYIRSTLRGINSGTMNTNMAGGNGGHNNMPPYIAVYVWERTA